MKRKEKFYIFNYPYIDIFKLENNGKIEIRCKKCKSKIKRKWSFWGLGCWNYYCSNHNCDANCLISSDFLYMKNGEPVDKKTQKELENSIHLIN